MQNNYRLGQILKIKYLSIAVAWIATLSTCKKDGPVIDYGKLQLISVLSGNNSLLDPPALTDVTSEINLLFSVAIDPTSNKAITLKDLTTNQVLAITYQNLDQGKIIKIITPSLLTESTKYLLNISDQLKGANKERFEGVFLSFEIKKTPLELLAIAIDTIPLSLGKRNLNVPLTPTVEVSFSHILTVDVLQKQIVLVGKKNHEFTVEQKTPMTFLIKPKDRLPDYARINLLFPPTLGESIGRSFKTQSYTIYTVIDETPKFPLISDDALLTLVQSQTFKYFWDFGHPVSGMARERNTSGDLVTSGGTGFGLSAMVVAVERGFITRADAVTRWKKIIDFLGRADRFHGAWSHWMSGNTGKVIPFSQKDDGGDLVETAFLIQGLLTVKQYLNPSSTEEKNLIEKINILWEAVEWSWYSQNNQKVLYWHWSPKYNWEMNHRISGHNETMIVYVLAAASPKYSIDKETYTSGYARNGAIRNGRSYYSFMLPLGEDLGGPLFFSHYSFIGLDPRKLKDGYADYWLQNVSHSKINHAYCKANPRGFVGYDATCWGLTASDNESGYSAHSPSNDRGVITPTAALSSLPYTPIESMDAIKHFYYRLGDRLWGQYGFVDAFNVTEGWNASSYLAIDQGPIICMIENHRTGLLWNLFMKDDQVKSSLTKLGFTF